MKRFYTLWLLMALLTWSACTPEEDDYFDRSASERIAETLQQNLAVLQGAENGWVMEYYPSASRQYGGYTMLVSFGEDGQAKVSCDFMYFDAGQVETSLYRVFQSTGPMLTFDTHNRIFHFFSNPSNELGFGDLGEGMGGDYEFLMLECTPERVVLQGRKTKNKAVMYPLPAGETWLQYLTKVEDMQSRAYPALYDMKVNGQTAYSVKQENRVFVLTNPDGSRQEYPFVYTQEGIRFYEPLRVEGYEVKDLKWEDQSLSFSSENVSLSAQAIPEGYLRYEEIPGIYQFNYYNNRQKATVRIREEVYKMSYIMEGFPWDIRVLYKADFGGIAIETQVLEDNIYLCPWALDAGGLLTTAAGAGMYATHQDGVFTFKSNSLWGPTDSFIVYDLSSGDALLQIPYVGTMVKKQ